MTTTQEDTMTTTTTPARCYREFCCNRATRHVVVENRSGNPAMEAIAWGWCGQHVHEAWEHRVGQVCADCQAQDIARATVPSATTHVCTPDCTPGNCETEHALTFQPGLTLLEPELEEACRCYELGATGPNQRHTLCPAHRRGE